MIEKYYNGAIGQVIDGIGKTDYNSLLVRYRNDFSVWDLESVTNCEKRDDIFFSCYEFGYNVIPEAYEPYLTIIRKMFLQYGEGTFADFMKECDVYELHRPIIQSYFDTGMCRREEAVILDEVEYEQERMTTAIVTMLGKLSERCPIMIVLNRFQLAARSTMALTYELLRQKNKNIGILLGVNDIQSLSEFIMPEWENILEIMDDRNLVYHIGNSERKREYAQNDDFYNAYNHTESYRKLNNFLELLDLEQAAYLLNQIERRIKFDNMEIPEDEHYQLLVLLVRVSILLRDISKALETCEDLEKLQKQDKKREYEYYYLVAVSYMYLGKLQEALVFAKKAEQCAKDLGEDFGMFESELLTVQIQMSGWCNIFFCAQDIEISDKLIEQLNQYHYRNHLAHIYIYAYDNKPEIVAKAYRSEALLIYFSKGIAIAKEIGNELLVSIAYQKNIMLASTNGMYEVSLLYSIRTYEALKDIRTVEGGRIYSGIAYNLCAMEQNEKAQLYFDKAIALFYELKRPEDIAEVQYNMSLNCIMLGDYAKAESYLMQCMRAIERLHLNSLRVCNLSKLYGLLALVAILQGNRFNCEHYLSNCRQFLSYILEKEKAENDLATVHDYAKSDDDLFLYTFSMALLNRMDGENEEALKNFEQADVYLKRAEGNQFFSYVLFRKCRMECFKELGKEILYQQEASILKQYEETHSLMYQAFAEEMKDLLPPVGEQTEKISVKQIEELMKMEGMERAYKSKKRQMDFISTWQKQIDVTGVRAEELIDTAMKTFLNHFNVDRAVYIRYFERTPQILYNDTECDLTPEVILQIENALKKCPSGFVVSKINSGYSEHQDVTAIFGDDNVCSMVAIPFFNNAKIESILITYVLMKDNWHSSVNRYMLDEDDLSIYRLLFREVRYSLNRLDAYEKVYEMNTKLYLSAVTDQLTGIFNREGFYRKLGTLLTEIKHGKRTSKLGLMFVDLDNFKHYNDTFGHDIGDLVLVRMADIFLKLCDGEGFATRYGGDEFLLLFYTDDAAVLEEKARRIYQEIDDANGFEREISEKLKKEIVIGREQKISCSIGITTESDIRTEDDINRMIKKADDLLYTIKTSGKGTYKYENNAT